MAVDTLCWEDYLEAYHAIGGVDKRYTINSTTTLAPTNVGGDFTLVTFDGNDIRIVNFLALYQGIGVTFSFIKEPLYFGGTFSADERFERLGFTLKPITNDIDIKWTASGSAPDGTLVQVIACYYEISAREWERMASRFFNCMRRVM